VAEEYLAFQLEVEFVGVFLDSSQQFGRKRLGAEFLDKPLIIDFALNFPGCNYHLIVVFFSVRLSRNASPRLLLRNGVLAYMLFWMQFFIFG
jgi:hypothetical protein